MAQFAQCEYEMSEEMFSFKMADVRFEAGGDCDIVMAGTIESFKMGFICPLLFQQPSDNRHDRHLRNIYLLHDDYILNLIEVTFKRGWPL